ncbi:hypothetical protein LDENG_00088760 [Lucifuga dentata]|nr:hypothetical protein LDENG_00088760 [Lucifuga dentata]
MSSGSVCRIFQRGFASAAASTRLSTAEIRSQRLAVFSREQARQRALYPRIEKIEVSMQGPGLDGTLLVMNKGMSTPLSCARHLTEYHVTNSALALVDGELWHLHRPLTQSCSLTLLTFKDSDPTLVNQAYWRSCAALLGQVLETAFKDDFSVELLATPELPVTSGAFCCDVLLDPQLDSWTPSQESLRSLSRGALQLVQQDLAWEPLEVAPPVALEAFSHSRFRQEEVEQKAAENPRGTYEVTALHNLEQGPGGLRRRAQGLSLPLQLQAHHTVWWKLRQRAEKLVEVAKPEEVSPPASAESGPLPPSQYSGVIGAFHS